MYACNYDEGACWLRSEDDGYGSVGGGPILPPGTGAFGDVPPDPQDATDPPPDCDPDDATELGQTVCAKPAWGEQCVSLCRQQAGVTCAFAVEHNITKETALLYKCCGCKGKQQCWYATESNRVCVKYEGNPIFCK